MAIIYSVMSPTGRRYVGQTIRPLTERWRQHRHEAKDTYYRRPFYRAIRKHGEKAFDVQTILELNNPTVDELNFAEMFAIALFRLLDDRSGYNVAEGGGRGFGWKHSASTREKQRSSSVGRKPSEATIQALRNRRGQRRSEETRRRMSEANGARCRSQASYAANVRWGNNAHL